jgi:tRNA-splicing ligase RtcB (3'-phosphate/5'-hydroxy nucleic acid ligase)
MKSGPDKSPALPTTVRAWLIEPMTPEVRLMISRLARAEDVHRIAIMPDVHLAAGVCVGTVLATTRLLYPAAVGSDIGCGMAAMAFNTDAAMLANDEAARAVLEGLSDVVPVLRHRNRHEAPHLPEELLVRPLSDPALQARAERDGRVEFGTLGRGNHFLEFQSDEDGRLWLMVHSGSRAMGQIITNRHAGRATKTAGGLVHLDADQPAGKAYLADLTWARHYADLSRRLMLDAAADLVGRLFGAAADHDSLITCDHDHVQREEHDGQVFWVHRKGANSASGGEPGIIPGSMGTSSVHVVGRGCPDALCSSSHGAGRRMARHEARRRVSTKQLLRELDGVWFDGRFVERLREEAPSAYKSIEAVLRAQSDLVCIRRRLWPVLVYKGV